MIRRAWSRLIRKQWLILYPLALAIINTMAFLAVYAASNGPLTWTEFLSANSARGGYLQDHFLSNIHFTSAFGIAIFAGVASCVFAAFLRAPLFHAIAGPDYPLAPRKWEEAANLSLFYLLFYLVLGIGPIAITGSGAWAQIALAVSLVVSVFIVFADYVIVFEGVGVMPALRRSLQLVRHRWPAVIALFLILYLVNYGLAMLYDHFYQANRVFVVLPIAEILLNSLVSLFFDLVFIYLYEDIRRQSPSGQA